MEYVNDYVCDSDSLRGSKQTGLVMGMKCSWVHWAWEVAPIAAEEVEEASQRREHLS